MPPPLSIDLDHLDLYVAGDKALLDEILSIFEDQAAELVEKLDPSLPDEEWRDTVHKLKGSARGLGAWALGDLCENAENLAADANGNLHKRGQAFQEILSALADVLESVKSLR
ncbi:MAG: Hpt domain-containing protein [Pseudomonadota bacterium]